jgi:hypothetical protein
MSEKILSGHAELVGGSLKDNLGIVGAGGGKVLMACELFKA